MHSAVGESPTVHSVPLATEGLNLNLPLWGPLVLCGVSQLQEMAQSASPQASQGSQWLLEGSHVCSNPKALC